MPLSGIVFLSAPMPYIRILLNNNIFLNLLYSGLSDSAIVRAILAILAILGWVEVVTI